jgi:hypothetical protein
MLHVLLPTLARCGQDRQLRAWLIRGDRLPDTGFGYTRALAEHFQLPARELPVAALMREALHGDAGEHTWVCVDPAFVQPDMTGARMLACGTLGLKPDEAEALAVPLRPLFGDRGGLLELSRPDHWHLQLPRDSKPPDFSTPDEVLGDDLVQHLPEGQGNAYWRNLFNEVQMLLHNHPLNAERRTRGQSPVNCLWFWGAGRLPMWIKSPLACVYSDDPLARTLAERAGIGVYPLAEFNPKSGKGEILVDLESNLQPETHWPLLHNALRRCKTMQLSFASGERMQIHRWHRWRVWRPLA